MDIMNADKSNRQANNTQFNEASISVKWLKFDFGILPAVIYDDKGDFAIKLVANTGTTEIVFKRINGGSNKRNGYYPQRLLGNAMVPNKHNGSSKRNTGSGHLSRLI
jgi:hypothetical protein